MKKITPVQVHLSSTIQQDGQAEQFTFDEQGSFVELNGKYYLRYIEHQGGTTTPVQFRLDNQVHLHRAGVVETQLDFDLTTPTSTRYRTEYGIIRLTVTTERLVKKVDPLAPAGELIVEYTLATEGQLVGTYRLQLQFSA
ncbi:DUF1934 domain-containing protein [Limosilactobacillus sp.]|uniref:DUF1934 domain-containing protein n=1 Tax=Limosilactobacillus sp. TaxID=2773925 RepID=UPI003F0EE7B7